MYFFVCPVLPLNIPTLAMKRIGNTYKFTQDVYNNLFSFLGKLMYNAPHLEPTQGYSIQGYFSKFAGMYIVCNFKLKKYCVSFLGALVKCLGQLENICYGPLCVWPLTAQMAKGCHLVAAQMTA